MKDYYGLDIGYGTAESVEDLKRQIDELRNNGDRRDDFDTFFFWEDLGVWADSHYDSESAQVWRVWLWDYLAEIELIEKEDIEAAESYERGVDEYIENLLNDYHVEEFDY